MRPSQSQAQSELKRSSALAIVTLIVTLALPAPQASASFEPVLGEVAQATPGQTFTLQAEGFAPGDRVEVLLQPTDDDASNTDAILPLKEVPISEAGTAQLSFVWPSGYFADCTATLCPRLPNSPWLPGQEVDIDVIPEGIVEDSGATAQSRTTISLARGSKHCGRTRVERRAPKVKVRVVHGGLACPAARALMRHAFPTVHHRRRIAETDTLGWIWRVDGWLCAGGLGQSEIFCFRGAEQVDGSGRSDDGWGF